MRRLTGVGSFLYQRFKRRTPHGKVGANCPNCSTENRVDPHGVDVGGWSVAGCVKHTEPRAAAEPIRRTRVHVREDVDENSWQSRPRRARAIHETVLLPRGAARRLHTVARDRDVPRPSSPRQMCARSCRVRACRLHRCPEGLLHPAVHLAFGCEMPKMTSDDGAAQPPTPGWERAARRLAAKARSRPTFPAIALSSSCTMA